MIPRKIHYCWFGRNELPALAKKCIASWNKHLSDYQLVLWNEDNFDINSNTYVKEAYENRKFAFVTDYVRLYAIYHHGGIYMDTDVEVLKPMDRFLCHEAFSGFESPQHIPTGILASQPGQRYIGELLADYDNRRFVKSDGGLDVTTNVTSITESALKYGLILNGKQQTVNGLTLYPPDYFCPFDDATGVKKITDNTYCIHWFSKSWVNPALVRRGKITRVFHRVFGRNCFVWLKKLIGEK